MHGTFLNAKLSFKEFCNRDVEMFAGRLPNNISVLAKMLDHVTA